MKKIILMMSLAISSVFAQDVAIHKAPAVNHIFYTKPNCIVYYEAPATHTIGKECRKIDYQFIINNVPKDGYKYQLFTIYNSYYFVALPKES